MSIEHNLRDMQSRVAELESLYSGIPADVLSTELMDAIGNVISEFEGHLHPDVENLINDHNNAMTSCDELEDDISELRGQLSNAEDQIVSLHEDIGQMS